MNTRGGPSCEARLAAMTPDQTRAFEEDGYFVLPSFWPGAELARLLDAVEQVRAGWRAAKGFGSADDDQPFSIRNLVAHHDAFLQLADHPRVLPLVLGTLGPNVQLKTSHLDYRPPEPPDIEQLQRDAEARGGHTWRRNSGWHADNSNIAPTTNNGVLPAVEIKLFYTLFDMSTSDCGNLCLVPGSHRRRIAELREWEGRGEQGAVELRLPAGAAVVWRTAVWHRVNRNLSDRVRKVMHIGYNLRWLRPGDYVQQDAELLRRCSPLRQQLLGAVPDEGGNALGAEEFEPTSAYWRQHEDDVPLVAWARERAARL